MREHPIPQDITNYRFHLIGSMTLKQFAEAVIGVIVALIFYSTNLPTIFKWFFIIISVGSGFAVAFVPIEQRPLDHWIITFLKKLYAPNKFYWRREPQVPPVFNYKPRNDLTQQEPEVDLTPVRRERIKEFLQSINNPVTKDAWELNHDQQVNQIIQAFDQVDASPFDLKKSTQQPQKKPNLKVRVRSMKAQPKEETVVVEQTSSQNYETNVSDEAPPSASLSQDKNSNSDQPPVPETDSFSNQSQQATTNQDLPFPTKPSEPNKLVGMVLSSNNDLLDDTIIEVKNNRDQIIRAVKSNSLGQFSISSPLANGVIFLEAKKPGYQFDSVKIDLAGEIVPPLEIRGHSD